MIAISERKINIWAQRIGAPNLLLAEQDFRLTHILLAIYSDEELKNSLAFKGGTAINKLYFGDLSRLSIDIDFNLLGHPKGVLSKIAPVRKKIAEKLKEQDPDYKIKYKYNSRQTAIKVLYKPLKANTAHPLKIEISTQESVPILGLIEKDMNHPDGTGTFKATTYHLDELVSTKIRALYSRRKGSDIFDLYRACDFPLNRQAIRKMVYYYFYRTRKIFNWNFLIANLQDKIGDPHFQEDITHYIRPNISFNMDSGIKKFLETFRFLNEPDKKDEEFLQLAEVLLGKTKSAKKIGYTRHITHPLKHLMGALPITSQAADLTVDDIKL